MISKAGAPRTLCLKCLMCAECFALQRSSSRPKNTDGKFATVSPRTRYYQYNHHYDQQQQQLLLLLLQQQQYHYRHYYYHSYYDQPRGALRAVEAVAHVVDRLLGVLRGGGNNNNNDNNNNTDLYFNVEIYKTPLYLASSLVSYFKVEIRVREISRDARCQLVDWLLFSYS